VVHRDLKPENIMIVRGKGDDGGPIDVVKVCDFGIAKLLDTSASSPNEVRRKHSTAGLVVGTPAYMSPEQARGEKQDARSDIYAVGIVLYELLAGRVPFEAETLIGVALKHVSENPQRPSARAAGVDPKLEAMCLKAISKKPADRYQSAREMRLALQGALSSFAPAASPAPFVSSARPHEPLSRHDSSKPTLVGVAPGTPAPHARHSRVWLALLLIPALAAASFVRFRSSLLGQHESIDLPTSAAPSAPVGSVSIAPQPEPSDDVPPAPVTGASQPAPAGKHRHARGETLVRTAAAPEQITLDSPQAPSPAPATVVLEPVSTELRALAPAMPTPQPASPKYDLALARVSVGSARNAVGATAAGVTRAVAEASSRITACYKSALPQLGSALEGADVLHVDTDGAGVIIDAHLSGPVRGSIASCVAAAVQGHRVANVDTGNASGDVPLSFRDH
jgi:eukaryotic-like serine/threonine-protein kinase